MEGESTRFFFCGEYRSVLRPVGSSAVPESERADGTILSVLIITERPASIHP